MTSKEELIKNFYLAFDRKDYKTMQSLYHPDAKFDDPAFPDLNSKQVKAMWQMLVTSATDLRVEASDISANEHSGKCMWQAWYTFTATERKVHNVIYASFEFKDGLIYRHTDRFDFWRWSKMALGTTGILLGWTPFIERKVRERARRRLDKFMIDLR